MTLKVPSLAAKLVNTKRDATLVVMYTLPNESYSLDDVADFLKDVTDKVGVRVLF
jgi:hypothetical protein